MSAAPIPAAHPLTSIRAPGREVLLAFMCHIAGKVLGLPKSY